MKIVVLSSHTPSLFWFRMDMMSAFIANGHEVLAIGNEPENLWAEKFAEKGVAYRECFVERNGLNPLGDIRTFFSLRKLLKAERPEKIFTYQAKTVIYGSLAANSLGINEVYPLIAGVGSIFLSSSLKSKIIRLILSTEYRFAMRKCPKIFFQNSDDVDVFSSNKIISREKVVFLNGSGVNLDKFKPLPFPKEFGFLSIARIIKDKGVFEYLEACKLFKQKYPQVKCLLVGPLDSNPTALKIEDLQPYIDNNIIEYHGETSDVIPFLSQCNVFVLASYREGTPKTVLEAMASSRAIITTDAPGCKETVIDGQNGYLVPIKNVDALLEKMVELFENPELVETMAHKGRKIAEEKFDVKIVNQTIIDTMKCNLK